MVSFQETDWLENFRMGKDTFMYICNQLGPHLRRQHTVMREPITLEKRIAVAIWRLATNVEYCTIGHLFGISRGSVCCIVQEVCGALVEVLMPKYIKWPEGEKLKDVVELFEHKWGYPQCCGAVDGSHIPILAPTDFHTDFFNRKGWHSIILQAVVDPCYRFTDITVGWPGSVHDARVLANSSLFRRGQHGNLSNLSAKELQGVSVPVHIIGDPAYPLLPWLMKGYSDTGHLSRQQSNFNYRLSRERNVVENAFGRLKGRWRCLLKRNDCHLEFVKLQVAACCTLHNICEVHREGYYDEWTDAVRTTALPQPPSQPLPRSAAADPQATVIRNALEQHFFEQ